MYLKLHLRAGPNLYVLNFPKGSFLSKSSIQLNKMSHITILSRKSKEVFLWAQLDYNFLLGLRIWYIFMRCIVHSDKNPTARLLYNDFAFPSPQGEKKVDGATNDHIHELARAAAMMGHA